MEKPKRILFLDLMRVLALFMMIQGHTTYDFLDLEIRNGSSPGILLWSSLRGYTAPFFMMVSGAVFTFLMLSQEQADGTNPRLKAGIKRIFTLLFWGYLLNFPIYVIWKIFTVEGWNQFMSISIGETLLTILWVSCSLYFYKSIVSEKDTIQQGFLKGLFRPGALKHTKFREKLFNKDFFVKEERRKKLFSSVFYGVIISIPFLIISNLLNVEEKQRALRVDILQIIAMGLLTVILVYLLSNKKKWLMSLFYLILILLSVSIHPIIHNVDMTNLPLFLAPYLSDFGTKTMFPLMPWVAYIFAGALLGIWLSKQIKKEGFEKWIGFKLALLGIGFILLSLIGDAFEIYLYGRSYFWHDSPNLVYHRIGVVLSVGAVMAFISIFIKDLPKFIKQMSRNTLWLYVGHLIIIYQIIKPIIGYGTRFQIPMTLVCVVLMFLLMYLQTQIIVHKQKKGGYINWIKGLIKRRKVEV